MRPRKRHQPIHEAEDGSLFVVSHNLMIIEFDPPARWAAEEFTWTASEVFPHLWYAVTTFRAEHGERSGPRQYMHIMIGPPLRDGREWDHIDGNGLNNRSSNLRAVTHQQNMMNRHDRRCER